MKKGLLIAFTVLGSMAFINCSSDDNDGGSNNCVECKQGGVTAKYCYNEGDNFYTMTVAGTSQKAPLAGQSWEDVKEVLKAACAK